MPRKKRDPAEEKVFEARFIACENYLVAMDRFVDAHQREFAEDDCETVKALIKARWDLEHADDAMDQFWTDKEFARITSEDPELLLIKEEA